MRLHILSWDVGQQPDLDELANAVYDASDGLVRIHPIDTGSNDYAIVVADHRVDAAHADRAYRASLDG